MLLFVPLAGRLAVCRYPVELPLSTQWRSRPTFRLRGRTNTPNAPPHSQQIFETLSIRSSLMAVSETPTSQLYTFRYTFLPRVVTPVERWPARQNNAPQRDPCFKTPQSRTAQSEHHSLSLTSSTGRQLCPPLYCYLDVPLFLSVFGHRSVLESSSFKIKVSVL